MKSLAVAALLGVAAALSATGEPDKVELVRWLVENQDELRNVSFAEVVEAATGRRVIPVNRKQNAGLLRELGTAFDAALAELNKKTHAVHGVRRVNEASRFLEDEIRRQVNLLPGWKCTIPLTVQDREQRPGYPDLRIVAPEGVVLYLDPKLYEASTRRSTLRTFYYEPRALTGKIREDAMHLAVGVEHAGGSPLQLSRWELIDLSNLRVQLKAEFQAGNRDVYNPEMVVGQSAR